MSASFWKMNLSWELSFDTEKIESKYFATSFNLASCRPKKLIQNFISKFKINIDLNLHFNSMRYQICGVVWIYGYT